PSERVGMNCEILLSIFANISFDALRREVFGLHAHRRGATGANQPLGDCALKPPLPSGVRVEGVGR
ncbi:MAG: hypothetical protein ACPLZY_04350, partial [Candidatus Norongarragalinales archaeon]